MSTGRDAVPYAPILKVTWVHLPVGSLWRRSITPEEQQWAGNKGLQQLKRVVCLLGKQQIILNSNLMDSAAAPEDTSPILPMSKTN